MTIDVTFEEVKSAVEDSETYSEIARKLFGDDSYSKREKVKRLIEEYKLEFVHKSEKKNFCLNCGKEIDGKNKGRKKFCSSSCAASYNNKNRKEKRYCEHCGKELKNKRNRYCSVKCQKEHEYEQNVQKWKDGVDEGWTGKQANLKSYIKRYLLEKHNYKCEKCGWGEKNPKTNEVPLQVHHIDGDCKNNKEENLQLLCPNCHSLTETFGRLNENSSRKR